MAAKIQLKNGYMGTLGGNFSISDTINKMF